VWATDPWLKNYLSLKEQNTWLSTR
jgi:hypothetical protein